jgi:hypothetical protein
MRIATLAVMFAVMACRAHPEDAGPTAGSGSGSGSAVVHAQTPSIYRVDDFVASVVVVGGTLVWTDTGGALYTMPVQGGAQHQLSNQHRAGGPTVLALIAQGDHVIGTIDSDMVRIDLPAGPLTPIPLGLVDNDATTLATDGTSIFFNVLFGDELWQLMPDGKKILRAHSRKAQLAITNTTLYALSWEYGTLLAIPIAGGPARTLARGLPHPVGLAADGDAAYVWSEDDRALRRIDIRTGEQKRLVTKGLYGTDNLLVDDQWIYGSTLVAKGQSKLFRVAKDGSRLEVLADGLQAEEMFLNEDALFVASFSQPEIRRYDKRALAPLCVGFDCLPDLPSP